MEGSVFLKFHHPAVQLRPHNQGHQRLRLIFLLLGPHHFRHSLFTNNHRTLALYELLLEKPQILR